MQVTETQREGLKRGYQITLTADELDAKVDAKLREAQPEVQMKGFRKGKVPLALLRKQFGERLMGEAMQEELDSAMNAHFEETGDRPAARPDVRMTNEDWKAGDDVVVEMSYEALPDIPEIDLGGISLERLSVKAGETEVEEALQNLADNAKGFADKEGPAESGDQVVIDFVGKIGGEPFEGGAAEDYPLEIGSESFIPGFEEQLVGAAAGESRDVTITFPEEYGAEELAGKEATFDVTVKAVKAPEAAAIDDALAERYGAENLEALRGQIAERLEAEYANAARAILKRRLLDALDEALDFPLPENLVEAEAKQIAHQLWHDAHPEEQGHEHGEIEVTDEHRRLAERRVKLGLYLAEIGRKQEIEVTEQELNQAVMAQARQYPGQERQFLDFVQQNNQMLEQIRAPIFEDKVVDYLLELVDVSERAVPKEELQAALDELEDEEETVTATAAEDEA